MRWPKVPRTKSSVLEHHHPRPSSLSLGGKRRCFYYARGTRNPRLMIGSRERERSCVRVPDVFEFRLCLRSASADGFLQRSSPTAVVAYSYLGRIVKWTVSWERRSRGRGSILEGTAGLSHWNHPVQYLRCEVV